MLNYEKLKNISKLQTRTLWTIAIIIVLVNMGVGATLGLISSHNFKQQLSEKYTKLTKARAKVLVEPIWTFEFDRAQFLLNELITDNNILEARIHIDKEIMTSARSDGNTASAHTITAPIIYQSTYMNEPLGQLAMIVSTDEANSVFTKQITESIIISVLLLLILSLGISRIAGKQLETT